MKPRLTVGITTRDRSVALNNCLRSLGGLTHLNPEVIVFDDASVQPVEEQLDPDLPALALEIIRDPSAPGYIVGRNRLVSAATADAVLLLDDDTRVLSAASIESALEVLDSDPGVAAVAFAQAENDGSPWPAAMQPSVAAFPCVVRSFIGFAHLVRRGTFLQLGGYRESFVYYGEEKDFCLRLMDGGHRTVYLPDARVVHSPEREGRSASRYLRFVARNDCLNALYNDPLPRVLWTFPARYALYFRMRSAWKIRDPWGWAWIAREVARQFPRLRADRRPVSRATLKAWRALKLSPAPYAPTRG